MYNIKSINIFSLSLICLLAQTLNQQKDKIYQIEASPDKIKFKEKIQDDIIISKLKKIP